jgi:hypothetical protein
LNLQIEKLKNSEKKLLSEKEKLKEKIKKFKEDMKEELNEKIIILKELEKLRNTQMITIERQGDLREKFEWTENEKENLKNQNNELTDRHEELFSKNEILIINNQNLHRDNEELLVNNQNLICKIDQLTFEIEEYKKLPENLLQRNSFLEEENLNLKCEMNLFKYAYTEIVKYRIFKFDCEKFNDLIKIEKEYVNKSPNYIHERVEYLINLSKRIIDEENQTPVDFINLKNEFITEKQKMLDVLETLNNELNLRRKIHSRYMNLRGNLRIMCRIRPFLDSENLGVNKKSFDNVFKNFNDTFTIFDKNKIRKYELDYIFNQKNTQQDVYDEVSLLVQNMTNETNICVISYGQTSTGKTYTIEGPGRENPGILMRTARELFQMAEENIKFDFKISLSILEIYNENVYDLLTEGTPNLNIFENSNGNLQIPDLHPIKISNFEETEKLCKLSHKLRRTSHTSYNDRSSRSHCIYTFYLKYKEPGEKGNKFKRSKMHIIDLAGSERLSKGDTLQDEFLKKESININLSLNSLSNVLNSICLKQSHIPYRDSKLTHFLKESLNEKFNILLMLHISPNISDLSETISTLEFGSRIGKLCKYKIGSEKGVQIQNSNIEDKRDRSRGRDKSKKSPIRTYSLGPDKKYNFGNTFR